LWYIEHKEGHLLVTGALQELTPKVELPKQITYLSVRGAHPGHDRVGIIFSLVILVSIEKGKQRNNQAAEGH